MNLDGLDIDGNLKKQLCDIAEFNRMPHAIIIEGATADKRQKLARFLACYAVCDESNAPCLQCKNCKKAMSDNHSDIITVKTSGKTNIISIETMRDDVIKNCVIKPNEASCKVYIFENADVTMRVDVQNTFLKLLEEPPADLLFIMTCENSKSLLQTIRSRAQTFLLKSEQNTSQDDDALAKEIVSVLTSPDEMELLYKLYLLSDRDKAKKVLFAVTEYLRMALSASSGFSSDNETANNLAKKLTKKKILGLIDATLDAVVRIGQNVNMTLLCCWLCGEYRRISWQR